MQGPWRPSDYLECHTGWQEAVCGADKCRAVLPRAGEPEPGFQDTISSDRLLHQIPCSASAHSFVLSRLQEDSPGHFVWTLLTQASLCNERCLHTALLTYAELTLA